jgi:hypothetical protein
MLRLIEHPAERRAMGAAARADSSRYSMTTVRHQWERLFADLAAARGRPAPAASPAPSGQQRGQDRQHQ